MITTISNWLRTFKAEPLDAESAEICSQLAKDLHLADSEMLQIWRQLQADIAACCDENPDGRGALTLAIERIDAARRRPPPLENAQLQLAVDSLAPRQRAILLMHRGDMTPVQIGLALHTDTDAVTRALAKIYADLRLRCMGADVC